MPLIVIGLAFVALIIYGAVRLYMAAAAALGWVAGIAAVVLAASICAGLIAEAVRRYRRIHGVTVKGERILSLEGAWGKLHVDASQKRGSLNLGNRDARFIFADIAGVQALAREEAWVLVLRLRHNAKTDWDIPMRDRREAHRWRKILALAAAQKL